MRVQERLLAEKDLKLDNAIQIARSVELAKEQVKGLKKNELTSATPLNESGVFQVGNGPGPTEILVKENFRSEMNISKERENLRKKQCLIASTLDADLTVILRRNVEQEMRDAGNAENPDITHVYAKQRVSDCLLSLITRKKPLNLRPRN